MKNELQVKINQKLGIIDFNYEEMKQKLEIKMEQYSDIVVTTDTKVIAKKDVASLRKLKKELNDRRIKVKREYDKPYDEFKIKVDELTGLIDDPIELIDNQVKELEEREREEKREKIKGIYNDLIGDTKEYLPLKKIYNKKWENVSTTLKTVEEEIEEVVTSVNLSIDSIKGMNSEVEEKALEQFKADLSLTNAIAYINKHEQMKAEIIAKQKAEEERKQRAEEERKQRAEEERIREEERKRVAEEARIREEARQQALEEQRAKEEKEKEEKEKEAETAEHVEDIEPAAAAEIDILGMLPFLEEEEEEYIEDKYIYTIEIIATAQEFDELLEHLDSREIKTEVLE